jgi:formate dehydrogenase iron-sulfur subunit
MKPKVFISGDSGALAAGAGEVAGRIRDEAAKRQIDIEMVRPGSRGMYWL